MNLTLLYAKNGKSYLKEVLLPPAEQHKLGLHSMPFPALSVIFREFEAGAFYDWHNAPRLQFIVYLEGQVKVVCSGGDEHIFMPGEALLAADFEGAGHTTETLSSGKSLIIPCKNSVLTMIANE